MNASYYNDSSKSSIYNDIIVTPYEKVLSIINSAKQYINLTSKSQSKLVKGLEWAIKIITSHSLYAYELKEKEVISKLSQENQEFKQFVDFVSEYNEQVIEMNKKNYQIGVETVKVNELLQKPSIGIKKQLKSKRASFHNSSNLLYRNQNKTDDLKGIFKNKDKKLPTSNKQEKKSVQFTLEKPITKDKDKDIEGFSSPTSKKTKNKENRLREFNSFYNKGRKEAIIASAKNRAKVDADIDLKKNGTAKKTRVSLFNVFHMSTPLSFKKISSQHLNAISESFQAHIKDLPVLDENEGITSPKEQKNPIRQYSFSSLDAILCKANYDLKSILEKDFNIFELENLVGHENVLPLMGRVMLECFGLINDEIISVKKLDPFLVSVTDQYLRTTLYHNSMHGADITQTICLFFLNSNAEEVGKTNVLDILSILISALGHDIGHPGLTNTFHINSSSEMAITYNDISCLENFHLAKLFKTIRKDETNIFEKLSTDNYKIIRKRMVGEILATDMANHGKIMTNIQSKIPKELIDEKNNNSDEIKNIKFELLSGDEKTKFEEQQALLDFFIHSADLAHNTKDFNISIRWVELLSKEFWLQGDKEKSMNLPISFLCDRENTNVPKSQLGFIGGFIIPTFNYLKAMFPSLGYTVEHAKINLNEWQKLYDENRTKGWSPREISRIEVIDNIDSVNKKEENRSTDDEMQKSKQS